MGKWQQRPQWEYKVYRKSMPLLRDTDIYPDSDPDKYREEGWLGSLERQLNRHGSTGWELVGQSVHVEKGHHHKLKDVDACVHTYTFKRWVRDQKIEKRSSQDVRTDRWMPISGIG